MTRRGFLAALTVIGTQNTAMAASGFQVRGPLTATEGERLEGYAQLGSEFMLVAHPKSAAYPKLMELLGSEVRVIVEPV